MALGVRGFTETTPADSASHTVTKVTGTLQGEIMVVYGSADQDSTSSTLGAPDGTWTLALSGGGGSTGGAPPGQGGFYKIWYKTAGAAEPASWNFTSSAVVNSHFTALTLTGAATITIAATATGGTTTPSTNHVAPTVTANSGDLLLCGWQEIPEGQSVTFTPPSGMTAAGSTGANSGTWSRHFAAYQLLSSTGATGTKTMTADAAPFTWGDSTWSIAIRSNAVDGAVSGSVTAFRTITAIGTSPASVAGSVTAGRTITGFRSDTRTVTGASTASSSVTAARFESRTVTGSSTASSAVTATSGQVRTVTGAVTASSSLTAASIAATMVTGQAFAAGVPVAAVDPPGVVFGQVEATAMIVAEHDNEAHVDVAATVVASATVSAGIGKYFRTPAYKQHPRDRHPLIARTYIVVGVTLLKFGTSYRTYVDTDPELITAADKVYLGGHLYFIDFNEAWDLEAAGYGQWLSDDYPSSSNDDFSVIDYSQYGAGIFGTGPYGA